jgi:hypothetical protein
MDLLELGLLWPLCGACVIGREMAWRGVCRGAFLPRSGEPRRIAFPAHATKSNRYIGPVLAAKLGTLTIADALAFGLEPDSFVRPGTASMRSLRRAQFFLPERRLRSPRRAGDVARLQVPQSGSYRNRIRGRHLDLSFWKPICPAANSKPRGKKPVPKVSMSRAADRVNLTKRPSGRGRYGGGSVGSKPQTPIERNWPHCGINAR